MAFEVASVKPSLRPRVPNFDLSTGNAVAPGGRLFASFTLWIYVTFAYKLSLTEGQHLAAVARLPKWFNTDFFEIDARAKGDATKDQMRLMMQSLLADRFKLAIHFETREGPALTLAKPGKTGPKLRPHAEGPPCLDYTPAGPWFSSPLPKPEKSFRPSVTLRRVGLSPTAPPCWVSRNTTMTLLADTVESYGSMSGEVDRPVVDRTDLNGTYRLRHRVDRLVVGSVSNRSGCRCPNRSARNDFSASPARAIGVETGVDPSPDPHHRH
jgi:uncharacterized protein (TIGR03435 family)